MRSCIRLFLKYNKGKLKSFLIEITAEIFTQKDDLGNGKLLDKILDKARQKGTGKWTSQNAMDLGIPVPTIDSAVTMRGLSSLKDERLIASKILKTRSTKSTKSKIDKKQFIKEVEAALFFSFITAYAQGLSLLVAASKERNYNLNIETIAKIWRGGCIIRAGLLEDIRIAYSADNNLDNLMVDHTFSKHLKRSQGAMRSMLKRCIDAGIPTMAFSSSLAYFDAYRSGQLPLNLIQAQRDHFGSHTYERIDRDGFFHTEWE